MASERRERRAVASTAGRRRALRIVVAACVAGVGRGVAAADPPGAVVDVAIENVAFAPKRVQAKRGARVVWTNRDLLPHTVTAKDGSFDSGDIGVGRSWSLVVKAAGRIAYTCTYHPGMEATLVVT